MRRLLVASLLILLLSAGIASSAQQEQNNTPLVAIIVDREIGSLSYLEDDDRRAINELTAIFISLGAEVITIPLNRPVPETVDVIVMIRPVAELNTVQIARLWLSVSRGVNLFLAFDPRDYNDVRSEAPNGWLNRLIVEDYSTGLAAQDLLIEPWFSRESVTNLNGALLKTQPEDLVIHPVIQPLLTYDLPVLTWAARSVDVYPLSTDIQSFPLLYSETAHGETSSPARNDFNLDIHIGQDRQGRLFIGSISENTDLGTRLVLLGDSEILDDRYGLSLIPGSDKPNFLGNYILAQRLAAWILEVPESAWPELPREFVWFALDGRIDVRNEWGNSQPVSEGPLGPLRLVHNDQYLYLLLEENTTDTPLELRFAIDNTIPVNIRISPEGQVEQLIDNDVQSVPDGGVFFGDIIEARIPLRLVGSNPVLDSACRADTCDTTSVRSFLLEEDDPARLRFSSQPLGTIVANGLAPAYASPDESSRINGTLIPGLPYLLLGRTVDNRWVKVQDSGVSGWVQDFQIATNTDINTLPVLDEPSNG